MPFKGVHGHIRHTHEDKVKKSRRREHDTPPKTRKEKEDKDKPAVMNEVELYNQPFEPFPQSKPAHYVNRFFRRAAQTVVHCVLALSPHFYMHTDELFDWMMPYERMGALLAEDAEDYISRQKALSKKRLEAANNPNGVQGTNGIHSTDDLSNESSSSSNTSNAPYEYSSAPMNNTLYTQDYSRILGERILQEGIQDSQMIEEMQGSPILQEIQQHSQLATVTAETNPLPSSQTPIQTTQTSHIPIQTTQITQPTQTPVQATQTSQIPVQNTQPSQSPMQNTQTTQDVEMQDSNSVSSIFSCAAKNPSTDHEMQVNPAKPNEVVDKNISHYHPPFLVIDSRRRDEYDESHIHGAVNIHYVPPKIFGDKFEFQLPPWVEKDTPIITYCAVGLRSGLMVWELRRRGYRFVKVLSGGYYKWVNEGRPIYASGELTEKVLEQHKLAGIMLRKELKAQKKMLKGKEEQDKRVASHHANDNDWPPCPRYSQCDIYPIDKEKRRESVKPRRKSNIILHTESGSSPM